MNLVFLSSFEKARSDGTTIGAQLSIAEQYGEWQMWWNEPGEDGELRQSIWYNGTGWSAMIEQLRIQLADKRELGYRPLLELPHTKEKVLLEGKWRWIRKLEWYGEFHADEALYEQLRKWRNGQAAKEGKTPYVIASNRLLKQISAFVPQTAEELRQIPGFGERRTEQYAAGIMAITAGVSRIGSFPLDWVDSRVSDETVADWMRERELQRSKEAAERREQKLALLQAAEAGAALGDIEPLLGLGRRELVGLLEELDKEGHSVEPLVATELAVVPRGLREKAWQAFATKGERYLRPVLKSLYEEAKLDDADLARAYEWLRLLRIRFRRSQAAAASTESEASGTEAPGQSA